MRKISVSNVVIWKDGKPITERLNKITAEISKKSGQGGEIEGVYVISYKFQEMNDYAKGKMKGKAIKEKNTL